MYMIPARGPQPVFNLLPVWDILPSVCDGRQPRGADYRFRYLGVET